MQLIVQQTLWEVNFKYVKNWNLITDGIREI